MIIEKPSCLGSAFNVGIDSMNAFVLLLGRQCRLTPANASILARGRKAAIGAFAPHGAFEKLPDGKSDRRGARLLGRNQRRKVDLIKVGDRATHNGVALLVAQARGLLGQ